MKTMTMKLARLIACVCVGAALLTACSTRSGPVSNPGSMKGCDPTGDTDARMACNR